VVAGIKKGEDNMCVPLDRLTNNIEYKNWTVVQQAAAIRAVCIACDGKCSKEE
jgi:hypothetical protein